MAVARRAGSEGKHAGKIEILSNCIAKYPSLKEGYIPRKLAEHHARNMRALLEETVSKSRLSFSGIDFVAYTRGPGMGHCLSVGADTARALGSILGVPVIGVNHALAHAEVVRYFSGATDPLVVYVSGGNTQILCRQKDRYHVLGETLDMGIGNFLDMLGRSLNLSPPDAVGVLTLAAKPGCNYVPMPYVIKGMSMSYSGMLTYAQKLSKDGVAPKDICFSAQETAFAALCEATERALCHAQKKEILLCGGNARNKRLAQMIGFVAEENNARLCMAQDQYLGDNAAMIALTALQMVQGKHKITKDLNLGVVQDLRMDLEKITWE